MAWKIRISVKIRGYKTMHTFTKGLKTKQMIIIIIAVLIIIMSNIVIIIKQKQKK